MDDALIGNTIKLATLNGRVDELIKITNQLNNRGDINDYLEKRIKELLIIVQERNKNGN